MARDEDLSLAVLQGVGPSQVGLYAPSVLGRWPPLHTLDEAVVRSVTKGFLNEALDNATPEIVHIVR